MFWPALVFFFTGVDSTVLILLIEAEFNQNPYQYGNAWFIKCLFVSEIVIRIRTIVNTIIKICRKDQNHLSTEQFVIEIL